MSGTTADVSIDFGQEEERKEKTTKGCKENYMTEEKMCEDFKIRALPLEPICPPTFCLITFHKGA